MGLLVNPNLFLFAMFSLLVIRWGLICKGGSEKMLKKHWIATTSWIKKCGVKVAIS